MMKTKKTCYYVLNDTNEQDHSTANT